MNVWLLTGSEQANASVRLGWFGDGLLYERGLGKAVDLDQSRSNVAPEIAWSRCQPSRIAEPMAAMIQINANAPPISSPRSYEHTSELQPLMRISYAVICLKKKRKRRQYA